MPVEHIVKYLEGIFYVSSVVTFLAGLYTYRQSNKERKSQDTYVKYSELQSRYLSFLELCIRYPFIDLNHSRTGDIDLSREDKERQLQLSWMLFAIMEEAYLLRDSMDPSQWKGWDAWNRSYCAEPALQQQWFDGAPKLGRTNQFAADFEKYIEGIFIDLDIIRAHGP